MVRRPVTLKSISQTLGLHVSTVSRVLNSDESHALRAASPEVIKQIRELAEKLDYRPNPQATSLKTRRSGEISVLMPRLSDLVMATIYEGIEETATTLGYAALVSNTLDQHARQQECIKRALNRGSDGIIIGDSHLCDSQPLLDKIAQNDTPFILVCRRKPGYLSVTCNDIEGGRLVAEHLYNNGHRNVAVLAGEAFASTGIDRTAGFLNYFHSKGISLPDNQVLNGHFDTSTGRLLGEKILNNDIRPTAIFAVNDFLAFGLMGAMRDLGLVPGKDIAVVGYNDTPLAAESMVSLTSVKVPMIEMGHKAMELLNQMIGGQTVTSHTYSPELIIRDSSSNEHTES